MQPGSNAGRAPLGVLDADTEPFDWRVGRQPRHEADTVIYELHVKGFTKHPSSGVTEDTRGTYAGVINRYRPGRPVRFSGAWLRAIARLTSVRGRGAIRRRAREGPAVMAPERGKGVPLTRKRDRGTAAGFQRSPYSRASLCDCLTQLQDSQGQRRTLWPAREQWASTYSILRTSD